MMVYACVRVCMCMCGAVRCGVCAMGSRWELPPREEVASAPAPRPYVPFEGRTTAQDAYVPKVLEDGGPTFGARRDTGAPPPERPYIPFEVSGVPGGQGGQWSQAGPGGLGCVGVGRQGVVCACVCMCVDGCRHEQERRWEGEHVHVCAAVLVCWCACLVVWLCVALYLRGHRRPRTRSSPSWAAVRPDRRFPRACEQERTQGEWVQTGMGKRVGGRQESGTTSVNAVVACGGRHVLVVCERVWMCGCVDVWVVQ